MQARPKSSVVFLLPFSLALSGCTLVGYPAGGSTGSPAPTMAGAGPQVTAEVPDDPEPVSTGRSYVVFGEEYRVLESSRGYAEEGWASWYGEKFHGRATASGETYDMHRLSAAHRTLPLHTWVEVTNLENGRTLVLRVNDRGPFAHTDRRILDLSYAAAQELGMVATGTARVRVRALDAGEVSSSPEVRS